MCSGDEEGFIERAVQLALNDALRLSLGRAARTTAEGISWDHVNDRFADALVRVWRSHHATPPGSDNTAARVAAAVR